MAFDAGGLEPIKVVDDQRGVGLASTQDVVEGGQEAMCYRDGSLVSAAASGDTMELRIEVGHLRRDTGPSDLAHNRPKPDTAVVHGAFIRFPALSLLLGQSPAQDSRCPALGKRLISVPISARIAAAAMRLTPGTVCSNAKACS
jgi:hypothetical protein